MARTSALVTFGLFALEIKAASAFAASDEQTFSKVADLKTGNVVTIPLVTYEPDYWLLSGAYKFKPVSDAAVRAGLISLSQSDDTGAFDTPPTVTITFLSAQSSDSLNIRFAQASDDYSDDLDVAYYDADDEIIRTDNYTPDNWQFSTDEPVSNFAKIIITFNSTNKPYRFLRVTGIDFGTLISFTADAIKSAEVVEQVDPLSVQLPVGSFDLSLFSSDATFSIINPTGDYAALQERQPLDVYATIDGGQIYIGKYFLDKWENPSDKQVIFRAIDAIGILDTIPYVGGIWTTATTAGSVIADIFAAAQLPYDLDATLTDAEVKGWIPYSNCREALQQVAFAIGAHVLSSRSGIVRIYPTTLAADASGYAGTITKSQKAMSDQSLTLKTLITGVEVTSHDYLANTEALTLYDAELGAGRYTIKFGQPARALVITGAAIIESGANYAIIDVETAGAVELTGNGYTDTTSIRTVTAGGLSNVSKKIVEVKTATLVNGSNVDTIAQRVFDYYQQRYLQKVKLFASLAQPSETVEVETLYNRKIAGTIERMTTNLSGGFVSRAEIVGVVSDD